MSDAEKRDAVLAVMEEFRMSWVQQSAPNGYAMVAEIARLRAENDHLHIQLGSDTGIDCCLCNIRIYGTMIGAGDGTGQKFAHPECYYRMRAVELESAVERVRALHGSKFGECDECHNEYPCPTLRALEGTP